MAAFMELCGLSSPAGKEGVLQSTLQLLEENCPGHPQKEEAYKKELILAVRFMPIMPKQISGRTMSP